MQIIGCLCANQLQIDKFSKTYRFLINISFVINEYLNNLSEYIRTYNYLCRNRITGDQIGGIFINLKWNMSKFKPRRNWIFRWRELSGQEEQDKILRTSGSSNFFGKFRRPFRSLKTVISSINWRTSLGNCYDDWEILC